MTMARLKDEYGVDAVYESVEYATARWIYCPDKNRLAVFEKENLAQLATDAEGHLAYLARSEWSLGYEMEQWPDIEFLKTREHGQ